MSDGDTNGLVILASELFKTFKASKNGPLGYCNLLLILQHDGLSICKISTGERAFTD